MASLSQFDRRARRFRRTLRKVANGRPRLSVYRSSKNIYAQIIDDSVGRTLAAASSLDPKLKGDLKTGADVDAASAVGNVGPGLGPIVGPAGNYATVPDPAKWVLSAALLLGRLELFTLIVMLDPGFWRG